MARPDRYVTVYVGATDDMPSMLKAHAGLPEHALALATMNNPPPDPAWIYGGLFHILLASKTQMTYAGGRAVEIHTRRDYILEDLGRDKSGALSPLAAANEWAPFLDPGLEANAGTAPRGFEIGGLEEGEHKLPVEEANIQTEWKGCSPAAFYNCLKYLESKGKMGLPNTPAAGLMDWIAICHRTNPTAGTTTTAWIVDGATLMFRGLGYNSSVAEYKRAADQPEAFLTKFSAEIDSGYPTNLGGSGKGVFEGHSTTGIGYLKDGALAQLIIHDGWKTTPNIPVYVKYTGYPDADLQYPAYLRSFHPGQRLAYPVANPKTVIPPTTRCDPTVEKWKAPVRMLSLNKVAVEAYAYEHTYYTVRGARYLREGPKRIYPFFKSGTWQGGKPRIKAGRLETTWSLVDSNGHLLKVKSRLKLFEAPVGTFRVAEKWNGYDPGPNTWHILENGTFTQSRSKFTGARTWTISRTHVKFIEPGRAGLWGPTTYVGTINKAGDRMSGTLSYKSEQVGWVHGTWTATRTATLPAPPPDASLQ